jgi:hypothetical protein
MSWATISLPDRLQGQDESPQQATPAAEFFELSLAPGVQLRGEDSAIQILRLGLFNKNVSVQGLDIGLVNQSTGGISKGLQLGLVSVVDGDFGGAQANLVSIVEGEFNGFQVALYNKSGSGESFQLGLFNRAGDIDGFQVGLVNWAENMRGIQVGIINIISGKESFQFLPIVNWSF